MRRSRRFHTSFRKGLASNGNDQHHHQKHANFYQLFQYVMAIERCANQHDWRFDWK